MENLKILHVSESFGWSGGAAQLLLLAWKLGEKGITNYIACPPGGDLWNKALAANFPVFPFNPKKDYYFLAGARLAREINRKEINIVHAHHPKAHTMALVGKILSKNKPILIVSRRVSHPIKKSFFARVKYVNRYINGYIAVAEAVKKILVLYGVPKEKIEVIYSGVDENKFCPRKPSVKIMTELKISEKDKPIGLIGNFSFEKGQHILLKAAAEIKDKYPVVLIFAGRETDSKEIKELARKCGFPPERARFLGLRDDIDEIISVLSLCVNCAVSGEALSGSARESMAMGIPVVASDIAGNREIVLDRKTGLLFPPGDFKRLSKLISLIFEDKNASRLLVSAGVKLVRSRFTVSRMVEKTLNFYLKLGDFKV